MTNSKLVYSTEKGRICSKCGQASGQCTCKKKGPVSQTAGTSDGIIRIRRETKGRKGKSMTTLVGFQLSENKLKLLAAQLKRLCGTGGSVKDGTILIQGDHRKLLQAELSKQGYRVKLAGG